MAVKERIPKNKRMKNHDDQRLRLLGHTLFSDESGRSIYTPWTRFQRRILESVCHEGLMDFSRRYPHQIELLNWALKESLKTGDQCDILVIEMVRVHPSMS